ncbi:hypothetical protein BDD43_3303 [Mucilaginibacter gracilis]|uniref:Uncharacterized protein n=1 Tax=Mucilaginibacter gracilis TaxID=423350 RepID=A0A495J3B4_9SPHI|nr:hypothetical protein [Mucilaginibacter gracilis]RKR83102.1 hypothetical protein BDD43_3303 [Mucilaginibacter gracilis]
MKLGQSKTKHFRLDIDENELRRHLPYLKASLIPDAQIGKSEKMDNFWIGYRLRMSFYLTDPNIEIVGYLGESRAEIFNTTSPIEDYSDLSRFIQNANLNMDVFIRDKLPKDCPLYYSNPNIHDLVQTYIHLFQEYKLYKQ